MNVLIIEDEDIAAKSIASSFLEKNHTCDIVSTFEEAVKKIKLSWELYDLITLDLILKEKRGEALIREIKKIKETLPILVVSSVADTATKVALLKSGIDDYIVKPFSKQELVIRAEIIYKRCAMSIVNIKRKTQNYKNIKLDCGKSKLSIGEKNIPLTKNEKKLLKLLIMCKGETVLKSNILITIWGETVSLKSNALEVLVGRLRAKIKEITMVNIIKNDHGIGYSVCSV